MATAKEQQMARRYQHDNYGGPDSDGDGLSDDFERNVLHTDPPSETPDGDGLNDLRERDFGSSPRDRDSDADGVNDYREVIVGLDPRRLDTNGDQWTDDVNLRSGRPVQIPDDDRDGQPNWVADVNSGQDSDGDGITTPTSAGSARGGGRAPPTATGTVTCRRFSVGCDPVLPWRQPTSARVPADSDSTGAGLPPTINPAVGPSTPDPDPAPAEAELPRHPSSRGWERGKSRRTAPLPTPNRSRTTTLPCPRSHIDGVALPVGE